MSLDTHGLGTAMLIQTAIRSGFRPVRKVVRASTFQQARNQEIPQESTIAIPGRTLAPEHR